jgi:hypothetical protein
MKKIVIFCAVFLLALTAVFAQTGDEVERLLALDAVTYGQAAWFLLRAADIPARDPAQAFAGAKERKWIGINVKADEEARLDAVALLLMRSFNIDGGALFKITKAPHYAYRELVYKNVIQGRTDPSMKVSGSEFLFIIGRALNLVEREN